MELGERQGKHQTTMELASFKDWFLGLLTGCRLIHGVFSLQR